MARLSRVLILKSNGFFQHYNVSSKWKRTHESDIEKIKIKGITRNRRVYLSEKSAAAYAFPRPSLNIYGGVEYTKTKRKFKYVEQLMTKHKIPNEVGQEYVRLNVHAGDGRDVVSEGTSSSRMLSDPEEGRIAHIEALQSALSKVVPYTGNYSTIRVDTAEYDILKTRYFYYPTKIKNRIGFAFNV